MNERAWVKPRSSSGRKKEIVFAASRFSLWVSGALVLVFGVFCFVVGYAARRPELIVKTVEAPAPQKIVEPAKPVEPEVSAPVATASSAEVKRFTIEIEAAPPVGEYVVQLGAFPNSVEAEAFVGAHADWLREQKIYLTSVEIKGRGTWYRVRVGPFGDKAPADAFKKGLPAHLGAEAIVVTVE